MGEGGPSIFKQRSKGWVSHENICILANHKHCLENSEKEEMWTHTQSVLVNLLEQHY